MTEFETDISNLADEILDGIESATETAFATSAWSELEAAGLTLISVPEEFGGSGGTISQSAAVLRSIARHGVAIPFAEGAWLAGWALSESRQSMPSGLVTAARADINLEVKNETVCVSGFVPRVPWARSCSQLILLTDNPRHLVVLSKEALRVVTHENIAGEPRDDVFIDGVYLPTSALITPATSVTPLAFDQRATLARVVSIAGAASGLVQIGVRYATERVQFGRRLGQFQIIQQYMARVAEEVACVDAVARAALSKVESGHLGSDFAVSAAKAVASSSVEEITALTHQVLGAIGTTEEFPLHRLTKRLWAWRDEFGNEGMHQLAVGQFALNPSGPGAWRLITE